MPRWPALKEYLSVALFDLSPNRPRKLQPMLITARHIKRDAGYGAAIKNTELNLHLERHHMSCPLTQSNSSMDNNQTPD